MHNKGYYMQVKNRKFNVFIQLVISLQIQFFFCKSYQNQIMIPNLHQDQDGHQHNLFTKNLDKDLSHDEHDNLPLPIFDYDKVFTLPQGKPIIEEHKVFPNIQDILQIKKRRAKIPKANQPKIKKSKDVIEENPNLKKGHWTTQQKIYNQHFIDKQRRRMDKIFKTMANFIGTRQAQQCRSHHQKMEKKYHSFYKIIGSLRKKFYHTLQPAPLLEQLKQSDQEMFNRIIEATQIQNDCRERDEKNNYREDLSELDQDIDQEEDEEYQAQKDCNRHKNLLQQGYEDNINMDFPWKS